MLENKNKKKEYIYSSRKGIRLAKRDRTLVRRVARGHVVFSEECFQVYLYGVPGKKHRHSLFFFDVNSHLHI